MDISHLHLHTRDRAAAEAFYRRWFTLDVVRRGDAKVGRNDPCPCGSGSKYKLCHGRNAH